MASVVVDTHAAIWFFTDPGRLSATARDAIKDAAAKGDPVFLSAISLVEIRYLIEKRRIAEAVLETITDALDAADAAILIADLNRAVTRAIHLVPRSDVPDMPDRIIAATALVLQLPLVPRDRKIQASSIQTIW